MPRFAGDYRDEVRNRLRAGERIEGPAPSPLRNGYVRRFAWLNGSTVHEKTVRPMTDAGELAVVSLGAGKHELVLA
jgi:hypothetical protein